MPVKKRCSNKNSSFYQIAFSEDIVKKFKREEAGIQQWNTGESGVTKKGEQCIQELQPGLAKRNSRQLFINLKKSLIMEDSEEVNTPSPREKARKKKPVKKNQAATRYEQLIYNRGSSTIILPERMVLPNGVEDIMLYPTAVKRNPGVFFGEDKQQDYECKCETPLKIDNGKLMRLGKANKILWSKESDPDVVIDQDPDS